MGVAQFPDNIWGTLYSIFAFPSGFPLADEGVSLEPLLVL